MRTHSPAERAALASPTPRHEIRVEIQHADGTWVDWTSHVLPGTSWGEDRDQPVSTATIMLHRGRGTRSLSPFMAQSLLNRTTGAEYAPALDAGRGVRISTNAGPDGWREVWRGRINRVPVESDVMAVTCSDEGAWLLDTQIQEEREYGSAEGTQLETVIQQILNDWRADPAVAAPVLYAPVSPLYFRTTFVQSPVKVLEAARQLALNIGWDLRYRYDAAHVPRLTLWDPGREREDVDWTVAANEYHLVPRLTAVDIEPIRTSGRVQYRESAGGAVQHVDYDNPFARQRYKLRWFQIPPQEGIDTVEEATALVNAVGHDLSGPSAEFTIETLYLWFVQLFDRGTFAPDAKGFDEAQTVAISAYRHTWQGGAIVTQLSGTARVVGAYAEWRRRFLPPPRDQVGPSLAIVRTPGPLIHTIAYTYDGDIVLQVDGGLPTAPPVSPIPVDLTTVEQVYTFTVTKNGQTYSEDVLIPALPGGGGTPAVPTVVVDSMCDGSYSLSYIAPTWTTYDMPSGVTFDLIWTMTANAPSGFENGSASGVTSGQQHTQQMVGTGPTTANVIVKAFLNGEQIAVGAANVTVNLVS